MRRRPIVPRPGDVPIYFDPQRVLKLQNLTLSAGGGAFQSISTRRGY